MMLSKCAAFAVIPSSGRGFQKTKLTSSPSERNSGIGARKGADDCRNLLAEHLDQDALGAAAVEFAVEDLFPGAEVELAGRDRDYHLAAHHLALMMRVAVVLAGAIVMIPLGAWVVRRQPFKPSLVIFVKAGLVVIDEDRGGDVHRINEAETLAHAAFLHRLFNFARDVHEIHPVGHLHGEIFRMRQHAADSPPMIRLMTLPIVAD